MELEKPKLVDSLRFFQIDHLDHLNELDGQLKKLRKKFHPDNLESGDPDIFISIDAHYQKIKTASEKLKSLYRQDKSFFMVDVFFVKVDVLDLWLGKKNFDFCYNKRNYIYDDEKNMWSMDDKINMCNYVFDIPVNADSVFLKGMSPYSVNGFDCGSSTILFGVSNSNVLYGCNKTLVKVKIPFDYVWREDEVFVKLKNKKISLKLNNKHKEGYSYVFEEMGYNKSDLYIKVYFEMPLNKDNEIFSKTGKYSQNVYSKKKSFKPI